MPAFRYCPECATPLPSSPSEPFAAQRCPSCGTTHYHNSKPAVEALILRDGQLLLAERAIEPFKGYWDIPGGFLEPGEHPIDGVRREIREETGLEVTLEGPFDVLIDRYGSSGDYTLNLCYVATIVAGEPQPADDVAALRWFPLHSLPSRIAFDHASILLQRFVASRTG